MECGMVGWSASRLAGWLAGCLAASVENRPTPFHSSSSLSSYVRVSLFIYICVKLVFGKCVCALRRKKKEGWRRVARSRVEERRWFPQRRNFSTRAPKWPSRGMGREILVSLSPFFFLVTFRFLWSRERNFNCAVVCLVMRIRAPFFHLVSTGNCWCRGGRNLVEVSGPSRVRVCTAKRKFSLPSSPHLFPICSCVDSTLLALSPTVVSSAGGVCFIIGAHGQEMDVRFVPRNHVYSPARYILHACILTPSRLIGTCVRSMIHAACC